MSIGKNTRKPVAAASPTPRTIDSATSDTDYTKRSFVLNFNSQRRASHRKVDRVRAINGRRPLQKVSNDACGCWSRRSFTHTTALLLTAEETCHERTSSTGYPRSTRKQPTKAGAATQVSGGCSYTIPRGQ